MTVELSQARSDALEAANYDMLLKLVQIRKDLKISQKEVGEALGMTQQAVSQFEQLERDPHLSTVAQYANVIGALVTHVVERDTARASSTPCWWTLDVEYARPPSYVGRVLTVPNSAAIETKRSDFAMAA